MRVQVFEQFLGGHHTNYLAALLPPLIDLKRRGHLDEVIVSLTQRHRDSTAFAQQLSQFEDDVRFDTVVPDANPALPLRERFRISGHVVDAITRNSPDFFISTTADPETLAFAVRKCLGHNAVPAHVHTTGMLHYGYAGQTLHAKDRLKDTIYQFGMQHAPWSRTLVVNPLVLEWIDKNAPTLRKHVDLVPDPVPPISQISKTDARRLLGLAENGRLIGYVGTTDHRKAIPELLGAFASAAKPGERLLIAGRLAEPHAALIEAQYREDVSNGRIQLLNRYLDPDEVESAFCALDVAAVLSYPRPGLSANLLKAVAARRPVLVDRFGYTGMMIQRFAIGHDCDVNDPRALSQTLRLALDASDDFQWTPKLDRLLRFHSLSNFSATVLESVYRSIAPDAYEPPLAWSDVIA